MVGGKYSYHLNLKFNVMPNVFTCVSFLIRVLMTIICNTGVLLQCELCVIVGVMKIISNYRLIL
jgi:hypothetical protein